MLSCSSFSISSQQKVIQFVLRMLRTKRRFRVGRQTRLQCLMNMKVPAICKLCYDLFRRTLLWHLSKIMIKICSVLYIKLKKWQKSVYTIALELVTKDEKIIFTFGRQLLTIKLLLMCNERKAGKKLCSMCNERKWNQNFTYASNEVNIFLQANWI